MARELTITVTAETSQAESSLNKVEQGLKDVETAAKKTSDSTRVYEESLKTSGKSADGLSGAQSLLTEQLGRYVSYAAIGAAIDRTIDFADTITDLAAQTGLTADTIQRLGAVADMSGSSMDSFASAVMILNKNLSADTPKVRGAIEELGLSMNDLMAMPLDDRVYAITKALGALEDKGKQTELSMALMGRGGKELTATFEEINKGVADTVPVMGDDARLALSRLKDAMYTARVGGAVLLGQALGELSMIMFRNIDAMSENMESWKRYTQILTGVDSEMKKVGASAQKMIPQTAPPMPKEWAPVKIGPTGDVGVTNFERASAALDKQRAESERAAAAANRLAEAQRKAYEASIVWGSGIEAAINYVANLTREIDALHTRGTLKLSDVLEFEKLPFDKPIEDLVRFRNSVTYFSAEGSKAWTTYKQAVEQADRTQQRMSFENLSRAFQSLPQTILGAVQGGGNVAGSIATSLFGGLGQDLGNRLGENIAKTLGGTLGKSLGSLGGPLGSIVGSLAGDLAGKLFGRIFGPSQQAQVRQMRDRFVEMAGGMDALRERAERAGVSLDRVFNARNTSEMQRAMDDFNRQLAAAEKHMQAVADHTEKFNSELGGLLREANDIGLILPDALNDSMLAMLESGQITGETAELLRALGQGGQSQFKAMEEAAKKYGIELSALGPAFQQNKLDKTAGEIIDAFNVLMKGGADVTGVLTGMSDEINKFVQEAIKSGRTVPENMRPILDQMLEQGKLTDENGQKMTDLGKIKFGPPIETAMDRLIKKIEELIDKFEKGMPRAFDGAASAGEKFARRVGTAIEGIPDRIEFGNDTPGFDRGGVVGRHYRPPTSRDVIPALLRPGEVVLTPQQAASGLSGSRNTSVAVTINVAGYLDSSTARASLADVVKTELSKQLRREGRAA